MRPSRRRIAIAIGFVAAVVLAALALRRPSAAGTFQASPVVVMGATCRLKVVTVGVMRADRAETALAASEAALRQVEAQMSRHIRATDISRLNSAGADEFVAMAPMTLEVLALSRRLSRQTQCAFDVTCGPVFRLWRRAGATGRLPTEGQLAAARADSGWDKIELRETGATKRLAAAAVDLGAVAKGYGIDLAAEAMIAAGAVGGLVDVGGDIRCFGRRADGGKWTIGIRDPFDPGRIFARISLAAGAVCTSGNYARYTTIAGRRHSHVIDPRSGRPADSAPSVTVVAPTAVAADAWATALSVLGAGGLKLLPGEPRIEAMIVEGTPQKYQIHYSPGFKQMLPAEP